jgi:hypothetical protein
MGALNFHVGCPFNMCECLNPPRGDRAGHHPEVFERLLDAHASRTQSLNYFRKPVAVRVIDSDDNPHNSVEIFHCLRSPKGGRS